MKKGLALSLVTILLFSLFTFSVSAMSFTDLAAEHWAYSDVQALVNDGTVRGYEDGSFRPAGTVTRAEFVKMLGNGSNLRAQNYDDVAPSHWAYSYIMSASFPEDGSNSFQPDLPITRGLVAELLWRRGGSQSATADDAITAQYPQNTTAVAWVYSTGLMQGDDGVTLRLQDTLSRAEAAALIVRARKANLTPDQAETDDARLVNVYNALNLFDGKAYAPSSTVTNGEMARAALRIGAEQTNLTYAGANIAAAFEHPYGLDVTVIFKKCLGNSDISAAFADQNATFGDTVAAFTYQFIAKSKVPMEYGDTTDGLSADITKMENVCLTFAKKNGIITLNEDLSKPVTLHELTDICAKLDQLIGSQSDITTDVNALTGKLNMIDHSLLLTDASYGDFRMQLKDMPNEVYTKPFLSQKNTPAAAFDFAREYSAAFTSLLVSLKDSVKANTGVDIRLTYFPSMVCENNNGYTIRVACDIVDANSAMTFRDLFPTIDGLIDDNVMLATGTRIYFDLATGAPLTSLVNTAENAYVEQIVFRI